MLGDRGKWGKIEAGPAIHGSGGGGLVEFEDSLLIRSFVEIILGKERDNVGNVVMMTTVRLKERGRKRRHSHG